ncbi:MAG: menaquinone biosynthesis protein [Planctomycetota bacterium]
MADKIRIGIMSSLSAAPYRYGLSRMTDRIVLHVAEPAALAEDLRADRVDAALIPSIEYYRTTGLGALPGMGISSRGKIRSIRLYHRVPPADVRALMLDARSRTSAVLARLILKERYGAVPREVFEAKSGDPVPERADAWLVTGNAAMIGNADISYLDLGEEWQRLTALPFVYCLWAVKADRFFEGLLKFISRATAVGLDAIPEIAREEAPRLGLTVAECADFMRDVVIYDFGVNERSGLALFYKYAVRMKEAPVGREMKFYQAASASGYHPAIK